ncbi:MAG: hypothetical protein VX346_06050 [Planctomycetota bacterium]|nr:hypothetical protein [Planctomycetota bacterium]
MSSPIEDFLRQAAERRASKPPPVIAVPVQPEPEVVVAELAESVESLEDTHLAHHIDTSSLAEHADHLGEEVSRADENVEQHVHEVFDHQVGVLDGAADSPGTTTAAKRSAVRRELKRAISNRDAMRGAVVFSEIIRRPEWRW